MAVCLIEPENVMKYDRDEAQFTMLRTMHYGPWGEGQ